MNFINFLLADSDIEEHIFFKEAINKINVVGHNVISVYDGLQLRDYLLKTGTYKNSKEPLPDIIMLDISIPELDGFTIIRQLKLTADLKNIPLYILAKTANQEQLAECRKLGCSGYFAKPVKNDKLTRIIETILEKEATRI